MNGCEDDRYELDVLLNRLKPCVGKVETILKIITTVSENDKIIKYSSVVQFKCIEKLYDKWSDDAIDMLIDNPAIVVPVISSSLKMKVNECEEFRFPFNSMILAPIQAGNYSVLKVDEHGEIVLKIHLNKLVLHFTL